MSVTANGTNVSPSVIGDESPARRHMRVPHDFDSIGGNHRESVVINAPDQEERG